MTKLVSIEGRTRSGQVNQSIVEMLTEWLEEAKAGKFKAIVIAALKPGGGSQIGASQSDCVHEMLGALAMLQFAMMKKYDEDAT